ncbi:Dyp-type peroxidase [Streptosporangium subroseum]|uniref:Dyp-type peroxidase n=1 Tax=Streptosporangium subroseum TaxID=106412 RepID=UPI003434869D
MPFHGEHQSGITKPPLAPQQQGIFAAYDVTAKNRSELTHLFHTLTERARFLTSGGPAQPDPHSSGSGLHRINTFVWAHPPSPEPAWTTGGTYQVIRIVRFHLDEWNQVPVAQQQKIIGRHKVTGIPLNGGTNENSPVVYDPQGEVMPFNCHIRLANPQTVDSRFSAPNPYVRDKVPPVHIWRRSYQYMRAPDINGRMDAGHAFCCFQRKLSTYIDMQQRLENEMLVPFITPTGGGYFFALPGVTGDQDYYARALLT